MKIFFRLLVVLMMSMVGVNAHAAKMNIKIDALITNNGDGVLNGVLEIGDKLSVNVIVDTTNPDINPSRDGYLTSKPASLETVFLLLVNGPTGVATTGTTRWDAIGYLDIKAIPGLGLYLPFTANITGKGMTKNQILPNFTSGVNGVIDVDVSPLSPDSHVLAKVTGLTITPWGDADGDGIGNGADADDDNDGIPDAWEIANGTNPLVDDASGDPDSDGLLNSDEYGLGTNPFATDTDGDGLHDASGDNCPINANTNQFDTDGDGQGDACDSDADTDGMPNTWESAHGLNPLLDDAAGDADGDGISNLDEYSRGIDPQLADTDTDGATDANDNCPINANANQLDTDSDGQGNACDSDADADGMPNKWESTYGLNPLLNDAAGDIDGDGISNLDEYLNGTNPKKTDTDGDYRKDASDNCPLIANPTQWDLDQDGRGNVCDIDIEGDGMINVWELFNRINPFVNDANADPDCDGFTNIQEYSSSTNPQVNEVNPGSSCRGGHHH